MSAVSVAQSASVEPGPILVAVLGEDLEACAVVAGLLDGAGLTPRTIGPAGPADATVIVFLPTGRPQDRVRAVQALVEAQPEATVVVVMDADASNAQLRRVLQAGAVGIVLDGELDRTLAATVEAVAAGQLAVPRALGAQIAPRALSYREKQILGLVAVGCTNREIAGRLYIAESTVKTHLSSAFGKLDATSRAEATAKMLDPDGPYRLGIPGLEPLEPVVVSADG